MAPILLRSTREAARVGPLPADPAEWCGEVLRWWWVDVAEQAQAARDVRLRHLGPRKALDLDECAPLESRLGDLGWTLSALASARGLAVPVARPHARALALCLALSRRWLESRAIALQVSELPRELALHGNAALALAYWVVCLASAQREPSTALLLELLPRELRVHAVGAVLDEDTRLFRVWLERRLPGARLVGAALSVPRGARP